MKINRAKYYARTREASILKVAAWRENNKDRQRGNRRSAYAANAESAKEASRQYRLENPAKINAWSRKHQLAKIERTPSWLTGEDFWMLEQAYELAALRTKMFGFAWHVDHVLPLQGNLVSGLHVPHNIQVIPASDNQRKSNKYDPV